MPNQLALLIVYIEGNAHVVPVVPQSPTPTSRHSSAVNAVQKKRNKAKQTENESFEEGEIPQSTQQQPFKEPKITRVQ